MAQTPAPTKAELVRSFSNASAEDQPIGTLALKDLPERHFREVVDSHNAKVDQAQRSLSSDQQSARYQLEQAKITTFAEFQNNLVDKLARARISAEHRKPRDFYVYRRWVLDQPPISTLFRETFFASKHKTFIPKKHRALHAFAVGGSGSGKTETLNLLAATAKLDPSSGLDRRTSLVIIDPHGDFAKHVAKQKHYWSDYESYPDDPDLIYVDPLLAKGSSAAPTINPFDVSGRVRTELELEKLAQQITSVFQSLVVGDAQLSVNMKTLLAPCIAVLLHRTGSTLFDLLRFMHTDAEIHRDLLRLGRDSNNPGQQHFFEHSFSEKRWSPTKGALSTKIQSLLNNQVFASFIARPNSTIDLERALNTGRSLVLNCAKGSVGEEISEAMGRFVVALALATAFNREQIPEQTRTPTWLIIDEAQNFVSPEIKTILAEARKYKLHLTLATQVVGQDMDTQLTDIVLGNTAVQMVGRSGSKSRSIMATEMGISPDALEGLGVGEFVVQCGDQPPLRMSMRSDLVGERNHMSDSQWAQLRRVMLSRYYRKPGRPDRSESRLPKHQQGVDPSSSPSTTTQSSDGPKYAKTNPFAQS